MKNTLILLRHGRTQFNPDNPVSQWALSEEGEKQAKEIAESGVFDYVDVIICSGEYKAKQTASYLADRLGKIVISNSGLNEIGRDDGGILTEEEHDKTLEFALRNQDQSRHRWETAQNALNRYESSVDQINREYKGKNILIVSHGTVMSLYFAKLTGTMDQIVEREKRLGYCDYGTVKCSRVVKGIV